MREVLSVATGVQPAPAWLICCSTWTSVSASGVPSLLFSRPRMRVRRPRPTLTLRRSTVRVRPLAALAANGAGAHAHRDADGQRDLHRLAVGARGRRALVAGLVDDAGADVVDAVGEVLVVDVRAQLFVPVRVAIGVHASDVGGLTSIVPPPRPDTCR